MSAVISKEDIKILTKQVMIDRKIILCGIIQNHQEISSSLLPDNVRNEYSKKAEEMNVYDADHEIDTHPISLDDFEMLYTRLDRIDKELHPEAKSNAQANITARKPIDSMKRTGSITDVNQAIYKSSSMMNLTTTTFAEPRLPPPPPLPKNQSNKTVNPSQLPDGNEDIRKRHVPLNMLEKFNALKDEVRGELATIDDNFTSQLEIIWNKLNASTNRLRQFFEEFHKMKALVNENDNQDDNSLQCLDDDLLEKLQKLIEVNEIRNYTFFPF